jgi:GGDEF domain-containing protein
MTDLAAPSPPRPQRARPIEWGVAEELAERAQAVAKGWLLALVERAPLASAGAIPAAALAAEGPAICAALARALGSDRELARLAPDGDLAPLPRRIPALAGATDAAGGAAAVDALRACLWTAALDAHSAPPGFDALATLAERLAAVAATVTATALGDPAQAPAAPMAPGAPAAPDDPAPAPAADLAAASASPSPNGSVTRLPTAAERQPAGGSLAAMDDGDLWIETLERHVDQAQREGGGLALLRVELVDAERIEASTPEAERGVPYGRLAQAVRKAIRRQDLVASDHHGRAWVIAPAVGRAGAIALAERIAAGVEGGEPWHGAPLAATIGFAIYGEDGRDAPELIERAEEAMLAASAAGVRVGEAIPGDPADPDRPPPRPVG